MTETDGYDIALIVSKRLRRKLIKASGMLLLAAVVLAVICASIPHSTWVSLPPAVGFMLVLIPVLCFAGAAAAFGYWIRVSAQAAIYGVAADDVLDVAARRGLIDRNR